MKISAEREGSALQGDGGSTKLCPGREAVSFLEGVQDVGCSA